MQLRSGRVVSPEILALAKVWDSWWPPAADLSRSGLDAALPLEVGRHLQERTQEWREIHHALARHRREDRYLANSRPSRVYVGAGKPPHCQTRLTFFL